jgi:uncharacterized membrane protein
MFRKAIANKIEGDKNEFRFRGHEVKRIEAFSDAVFAFAVTLLIVSLEVPKSYEELLITMRGFFAFGISFILLMFIWYEQNIFFKRYGLDDLLTIVLNCTLIFLVLFYVYPLKFLFTLVFSQQIYGEGNSPFLIKPTELPQLMVIYATGYIFIYLLFSIMYLHAVKKRAQLELTVREVYDSKTKIYKNLILIAIGVISILVVLNVKPGQAGFAGFVYFLIGPSFSIFFRYRSGKRKKLFALNLKPENTID